MYPRSILARRLLGCLMVSTLLVTLAFDTPSTIPSAAEPSHLIWPVKLDDGQWAITSGYYNYDHGCWDIGKSDLNCNKAYQLYGLDLARQDDFNATAGRQVISPATGIIAAIWTDGPPGVCIVIAINGYPNAADGKSVRRISLCHVDRYDEITVGKEVTERYPLGTIASWPGNHHLHFSVFELRVGGTDSWDTRTPIPFTGSMRLDRCRELTPNGTLNWEEKTYNGKPQWFGDVRNVCSPAPGGWWVGPTPSNGSVIPTHNALKINVRAVKSESAGLSRVNITLYNPIDNLWRVIKTQSYFGVSGPVDVYTEYLMPNAPYVLISFDVFSTDGSLRLAPNGVRKICTLDPCQSTGSTGSGVIGGGASGLSGTAVALCTERNYGGVCKEFSTGTMSDLAQFGLSQNVSSIIVPSGYTLFMYDGTNRNGQPGIFNQSSTDLVVHNWNDRAKSLTIETVKDTSCSVRPDANGIVLYRDTNFKPEGGCKLISASDPDLGQSTFVGFNALRFVGNYQYNYKATAYTDANYGNACGSYWLDQSDLRECAGIGVSVKVEPYVAPPRAENIAFQATRDAAGSDAVVDDNLSTEWIGGNRRALGFLYDTPRQIQSVVVFDRAQSGSDNNQINKLHLVFSDGTLISDIDMISGGPRCAEVSFPARSVSWVNVVPIDASGKNGFKEVQIWDTTGSVYSQNNCVNKLTRTPVSGTGSAPTIDLPAPPQAPTRTTFDVFADVTRNWYLNGSVGSVQEDDNAYLRFAPVANSSAEASRNVGWPALSGYDAITLLLNLHGATLPSNDSSALYLEQGGTRKYITLSSYVEQGLDGWQNVTIPLTAFTGFTDSASFSRLGFRYALPETSTIDVDEIDFVRLAPTPPPGSSLIVSIDPSASSDGQAHGPANPYLIPEGAEYDSVHIRSGAYASTQAWNGEFGGVVRLSARGTVQIDGVLTVDSKGYRGGPVVAGADDGRQGESYAGRGGKSSQPNAGGGGGGAGADSGGGGGAYGSSGQNAVNGSSIPPAYGGTTYGDPTLSSIYLGSGGGSSGAQSGNYGGGGGAGAGAVSIIADTIIVTGRVSANGGDGSSGGSANNPRGGGGGSGGSILLRANTLTIGTDLVTALGGRGGYGVHDSVWPASGGNGGTGRIRLEYCDVLTGVTNPPASTQDAVCSPSTPPPDLHPLAPSGYSYPVVPSSIQGTHEVDALVASQPSYFDWYFVNSGTSTALGPFYVELWVDDTRYARYILPDFLPGWDGGFDDWKETIATPGWHTIRLITDPDNRVVESDETNNTWKRVFYWVEKVPPTGTITINGVASYTNKAAVSLALSASDPLPGSGVASMRFSNDRTTWSTWEPYATSKAWTLPGGDGTKTIYVQFRDKDRNISVSAQDTIVLDTSVPVADMPTQRLIVGARHGTNAVQVHRSWPLATDNLSGIKGYRLQQRKLTASTWGPFATLASLTPATTNNSLLEPGTYQLRVQAQDGAGNWSRWVLGASFTVKAYQETDPAISFTGAWTTQPLSSAFGGFTTSAYVAGDKATFTFPAARSIAWVAQKSSASGIAEVWLDNVKIGNVNLYQAGTPPPRTTVFVRAGLDPNVTHILEIRALGTKYAASTGTQINIDAFVTLR